ncbi:EAL domain-containing protein [Cohnella abietis]|uniref:Putative EAL-domain containing protein YkuI n=1 Tax=Cohnella abietis TaxID=2507935 RepID=A0A3T1DB94_9BACL|nr:EAL domain-containing protein [Cohnella abietis]BBI35373.1 putative EAL-domain containing protein YkuI [Cohnella abietis]
MSIEADNSAISPSIPQGMLLAYFQPIIALETGNIVGYEALGRQLKDGIISSLGPFFSDSSVPVEQHVCVDRLLREQAISKLSTLIDPPTIYINLKPSWIYQHYKSSGELHTLQLLDKYGINPNKVCIEITEEEFCGSMAELNEIINLYRAHGCQIAIDDIGTGFSNFDRIAQIQPNLLKVDIHLMKKSASHSGYLGVLRSFSTLAEQIGASLLVEGVETSQDLKRAIQIGARYVQGFLFSQAEPEFRSKETFATLIETALDEHRQQLQASRQLWEQLGKDLVSTIQTSGIHTFLEQAQKLSPGGSDAYMDSELADEVVAHLLPHLDISCMRVYLCRSNGIQISANHYRNHTETWQINLDYRKADWSWRPYFIPHLSHDDSRIEAKVSTKYADLDTHAWIRTLSIPISKELVLLIDIADNTD